ncbi:putative thiamine pyrophosphokinase [Xylaria bambusicola]|uniref:putative thiamine pyrophosphokinase n=1 Tax=Xylaria bambusicola TaxID=326684 RepID=UPI0020089C9B|nr:putative thiamine pyrophosphokinase [Xylaria bambusicola]KAI0520744.1 putative thiamine pyrophosphokinase [Xylaria bambusicola]
MPWTSDFRLDESSRIVQLSPVVSTDPEVGTTDVVRASAGAITKLLQAAQEAGSFPKLYNWPNEKFPFAVDRAIAPYLGIVTTGPHLNAFVRDDNGLVASIWVAKRGMNKPMYPGMLDNAVGGAVVEGETPRGCLLREAMEEIGIDAKDAVSGGTVSWFRIKENRTGFTPGLVEPGVQYVYDLGVGSETILHSPEAGTDWLHLLSINEVMGALRRHEFKPSSACVMIDFLIRHGIITAETDPDFADVVSRLHRKLSLPTRFPEQTRQQ